MKPVAMLSTFAVVLFSPLVGAQQVEKPAAPDATPDKDASFRKTVSFQQPEPKVVTVTPLREIKLADYTWMRFGFQVQTWLLAAQDRIKQPDGSDGGYAFNIYCRRCRVFATGSIVKDVTFNLLFEAGRLGNANAAGDKGFNGPAPVVNMLDAYGMVKFAEGFQLMAGSMVVPFTRNGNQPTTTYLPIDIGNVSATVLGQAGVFNVLRDLGLQAVGYLADDHLEYRLGVFQGLRAPATTFQSAGHNMPLVNAILQYNFWDTEKGYVWGGHYYGTKKVLGLFGSAQYQKLRKADAIPGGTFAGTEKNPFLGFSAAAFINYPLNGKAATGGDEFVALAQFSYYDGGTDPNDLTKAPSYPSILKQTTYLGEAAYYNKDAKISVFGKFEMRKLSGDFPTAVTQAGNQMWIAGGLKYYIAPANICNIGIQYERSIFKDAPDTVQGGTNTVTAQLQFFLY